MYVLCKTPPSTKKTPLVYETDGLGICPVCGEAVKINPVDLAMKKIVYHDSHVVSNNPDSLRFEKSLIMTDHALKGATT